MTTLAISRGDIPMPDAIQSLDVKKVAEELGFDASKGIPANAFIHYLSKSFGYTFEYARDMLYKLIDVGRLVLTERYTLVLAE